MLLGHVTQVVPPVPQALLAVPGLQVWVVASQQPFGQVAVVQTQVPFWHSRFAAVQSTQTLPAVPQVVLLLVRHVPFWQQPFGQLAGVQTHEPF